MLVEEIEKAWVARAKSAPFYPTPTFVGDALTLGAGTVIARTKRPLDTQEKSSGDTRVVALLATAFRRAIGQKARAHLRCALEKRAEGDELVASIHLALMGLPRLDRNNGAARRLFAADRLLQKGVTPETIFAALDLDPTSSGESLRKYNPNQPRVPAGSGRMSGQWTSGGDAQAAATPAPNLLTSLPLKVIRRPPPPQWRLPLR